MLLAAPRRRRLGPVRRELVVPRVAGHHPAQACWEAPRRLRQGSTSRGSPPSHAAWEVVCPTDRLAPRRNVRVPLVVPRRHAPERAVPPQQPRRGPRLGSARLTPARLAVPPPRQAAAARQKKRSVSGERSRSSSSTCAVAGTALGRLAEGSSSVFLDHHGVRVAAPRRRSAQHRLRHRPLRAQVTAATSRGQGREGPGREGPGREGQGRGQGGRGQGGKGACSAALKWREILA